MLSTTAFLVFFAGTTQGFLQFPLSPAQIARQRKCSVSSNYNAELHALTATNMNVKNGSRLLRATGFPSTRRNVFGIAFSGLLTNLLGAAANASSDAPDTSQCSSSRRKAIAYRTISLPVDEFGVKVPVSVWYPVTDERAGDSSKPLPPGIKYDYKISLRRIGQLLAKWEFIPEIISKDFSLTPSASVLSNIRVVDGNSIPIPGNASPKKGDGAAKSGTKVVFLAHGFLGSRSDLAYIAEDLASQGFVCVAAEYPESLEASYPRLDGLDRVAINKRLIPYVEDIVPKPIISYSAIGHSLGCGTIMQMGDDSWNRVMMGTGRAPALPSARNKPSSGGDSVYKNPIIGGRLLFITSVNDSLTKFGGGIQIPDGYTILNDSQLKEDGGVAAQSKILDRTALVFNGEKAPNHISYLSANVNDAMLSFLSPLLPVTKALGIPVLDFDKYADSRDSVATGTVLKPVISSFLVGAPEVSAKSKS